MFMQQQIPKKMNPSSTSNPFNRLGGLASSIVVPETIDESLITIPQELDIHDILPSLEDITSSDSSQDDLSISSDFSSSSERSLAATLGVDHSHNQSPTHNPLIVGHRGSPYAEPENTLPSFLTSAAIGCHAVELDVFLLKCGTLAVFHGDGKDDEPGFLDGYCGIPGANIRDYTADEARRLSFVTPPPTSTLTTSRSPFACSPEKVSTAFVPTLREVLEDAKRTGVVVKIELKGPGTEIPALKLVEEMNMVDQCTFASFRHDRIAKIRELRPERREGESGPFRYNTGALFNEVPDDFIDMAKRVGASEVHLRYDTCTRERVESIHEAGMGSMAWFRGPNSMLSDCTFKYHDVGNEDCTMYQTVLNTGVKSMCVNRPDILVDLIEKRAHDPAYACLPPLCA